MKTVRRLLLALILWMTCVSLGQAHAFLDHADPPVGSSVHGSPSVIKIWFTRHIKPGESTITISDACGREVKVGEIRVDPTDPNLLFVTVSSLAPGTYKVVWKAVCFDTHVTHGSFTFKIEPK